MVEGDQVSAQKRRADRAWQENAKWDARIREAYDFAIPFREGAMSGAQTRPSDLLFDMTAPTSAMNLAGQLQRLLFSHPPKLAPGALVRQALNAQGPQGARDLDLLERQLEQTGKFIYPFMEAGDLDTVTHEMCIDLGLGTGVIIPMRGTPDQPIVFFAPPPHEVAFWGDAYGRTTGMSWKKTAQREGLIEAFPKGNFSEEFRQAAKQSPDSTVCLYQDFWRRPDGYWQFAAYHDGSGADRWITSETYRTKPFASPRYYRVSGEMRGRGPILLALPTIKSTNKAQELTLKAAALQLLGIWGYRANSGFNPDTAPQTPGAFWAMQSTGGIMGPDVTRLDPASARFDIAQMVIDGSQQQIRDAMMDTRLVNKSGTPRSASEIAGFLQQESQVHLGGFMRLWREVHPEIVPRCAEILNSFGYLGGLMDFNQLIVSVGVRSPMAAALDADRVANIARYAEIMNALVGPNRLPEHLDVDLAADEIADGMMLDRALIPSPDQRDAIRKALQQQQAAAADQELAAKAAPQVAGGVMRMIDGGKAAA